MDSCTKEHCTVWHLLTCTREKSKFVIYHRCHRGQVHRKSLYSSTPVNVDTSATKCVKYNRCQRGHSYSKTMYSKTRVNIETCELKFCTNLLPQRWPGTIEICMSLFEKHGSTIWHENYQFCNVWNGSKCDSCVRNLVNYGTGQDGHV